MNDTYKSPKIIYIYNKQDTYRYLLNNKLKDYKYKQYIIYIYFGAK